jgi:hypothetical protein
MIKTILKTLFAGWVAKKIAGRGASHSVQQGRRVARSH